MSRLPIAPRQQQIGEPPPPLSKFLPDAPPALTSLILKTLAKEPEKRPTMKQLVAEFAQLLAQLPDSATALAASPRPVTPEPPISTMSGGPTVTRDSHIRRHRPAWRRRLPYIIAGVVGLAWLVALAFWALA